MGLSEKDMDIERIIVDGESVFAFMLDEELELFQCKFNNDNCVTIDVENFDELILSPARLQKLIDLIDEADEICAHET